jgi:uncharacterized membrane protein
MAPRRRLVLAVAAHPAVLAVHLLLCFRFFVWRAGWWRGGWGRSYAHYPNAREILAERYARSEISVDEYHERLANLQDPSGRSDL